MAFKGPYYIYLSRSKKEFFDHLFDPPQRGRLGLLLTKEVNVSDIPNASIISKRVIKIQADRGQLSFPESCIIADTGTKTGLLARHYAAFLGRPFLNYSDIITDGFKPGFSNKIASLTVFTPDSTQPTALWKNKFEHFFQSSISYKISFGYILPLELEEICQYFIRIIAHFLKTEDSEESTQQNLINDRLAKAKNGEEIIKSLRESRDTIFVDCHSKPSCAALTSQGGAMAICGSPTKGENGKCFSDINCTYAKSPRMPLSELAAEMLFLNGCNTVSINRKTLNVPRNYTLGYSAMAGSLLGYIGNNLATRAYQSDVDWMQAFLQMKMKPAKAVRLINDLRKIENREHANTCMFVGDAEYLVYNTNYPVTYCYTQYSKEISLEWNDNNMFLCLIVRGDRLSTLSSSGLINMEISKQGNPTHLLYGNVLYNYFSGYSTVLFKKKLTKLVAEQISIKIVTLNRLKDNIPCRHLEFLYNELTIYQNMPPYQGLSSFISLWEVKEKIIEFNSQENDRINRLWKDKIDSIYSYKASLIQQVNTFLIKEAQRKAKEGWAWDKEYIRSFYLQKENGFRESTCRICGNTSFIQILSADANSAIKRESEMCPNCGEVRDMPIIDLACGFYGRRYICGELSYQDWVYFKNNTKEDITVTYGLAILNQDTPPEEPITRVIKSGQELKDKCTFSYKKKPSGVYKPKLYLAFNGAFGFISRSALFKDEAQKVQRHGQSEAIS